MSDAAWSATQGSELRVLFVPRAADNPYQRLLIEALAEHGVSVRVQQAYRRFPLVQSVREAPRPEVLHLHWTTDFWVHARPWITPLTIARFLAELWIVKALGVRIVWTVHNLHAHDSPHPRLEHRLNALCCRLYDEIIVHSGSAAKRVRDTYGLTERVARQIRVTGHGHFADCYANEISREAARERLGIAAGAPVFLHFGRIRPYKGSLQLIDAFRRLDHAAARLLIVGRPETEALREDLERACAADARIRLDLRDVPADEIQTFMNAADALVLPFREVLTSSTVILGMSFGKAIVAPRLGEILETVGGDGGIVYDDRDAAGLVNALRAALDADLRAMGRGNLVRARRFDWAEIAQKTAAVYDRCARS